VNKHHNGKTMIYLGAVFTSIFVHHLF